MSAIPAARPIIAQRLGWHGHARLQTRSRSPDQPATTRFGLSSFFFFLLFQVGESKVPTRRPWESNRPALARNDNCYLIYEITSTEYKQYLIIYIAFSESTCVYRTTATASSKLRPGLHGSHSRVEYSRIPLYRHLRILQRAS